MAKILKITMHRASNLYEFCALLYRLKIITHFEKTLLFTKRDMGRSQIIESCRKFEDLIRTLRIHD